MFIQTEDTPNPATMKFLPGREVLGDGSLDVDAATVARSPLAQALFAVDGVKSVFLGRDFITVTREEGYDWPTLKPALLTAIMEHFVAGKPVVEKSESEKPKTASYSAEDKKIVEQICEILDLRIRPAVAQDGGDIVFHSYEDGIVFLTLKGACAGCPSSTATLKMGVEKLLKELIPEVREVRPKR